MSASQEHRRFEYPRGNWSDLIRVSAFLLTILALPVIGVTGPGAASNEKAPVTQLPDRPKRLAEVRSFPAAFEKYYDDHLGYRRELLKLNGYYKIHLLGTSSSKQVVFGDDGWMYYRTSTVFDEPDQVRPDSESINREWVRHFLDRKACLDKQKIHYFVTLAPEKQSVHPEKFPKKYQFLLKSSLYDQFTFEANEKGLPNLDLKKLLLQTRETLTDSTYLQLDTHWKFRGARYAADGILRELQKLDPKIELLRDNTIQWQELVRIENDLLHLLGDVRIKPLNDEVPIFSDMAKVETWDSKLTPSDIPPSLPFNVDATRSNAPGKLRVVLLHDSFGDSLKPFLQRTIPELICIRTYSLPDRAIEMLKPDIVIQLLVERGLKICPVADTVRVEGEAIREEKKSASTISYLPELKIVRPIGFRFTRPTTDTPMKLTAQGAGATLRMSVPAGPRGESWLEIRGKTPTPLTLRLQQRTTIPGPSYRTNDTTIPAGEFRWTPRLLELPTGENTLDLVVLEGLHEWELEQIELLTQP
jgi:alginate O-acetyltransferase complex protein AlgJ